MKVNIDIRDLKQGRYMIFILSAQITCKKIKYADSHAEATEVSDEYERVGCICIITRVLNNTLNQKDKWSHK